MINLKIIAPLLPESVINEPDADALRSVVASILAGARAKWISLAGSTLSSTRRDYINGIQKVRLGNSAKHARGTVSLVGTLPNMVENGAEAYDMHATLLGPDVPVIPKGQKGKGKRQGKDGSFYRAIPFRHQTPGTIGQGGGPPMGSAYEGHPLVKDAAALGKQVHGLAQKLAATKKGGGYGERLEAGAAGTPKLKPAHSVDIYAGMIRSEQPTKNGAQNTYTTFRMISDNVPDKWLHPGIEAVHLADKVSEYVDKIAPAAFAALVAPSD